MAKLKDLTGKKWGYVSYIEEVGLNDDCERLCLCKCGLCGRNFIIRRSRLLGGGITSCGCGKKSNAKGDKNKAATWDLCNDLLNLARKAAGEPMCGKEENPYRQH